MSTLYIAPTGSGNQSGSDWANAAPITSLDTLIKKAGPGGTVLLQADAGDYNVSGPINITANIAGLGVTVKGVDKATGADMNAHIEGTRPAVYAAGNPAGNELFKFQAGSGNLTFENMTIDNTGTAFRAAGDTHNITINNVDANNVARFFEDTAGGTNTTATISGLTLTNINVEGFSKGAVRLQYDTNNVLIQNMVGDSQRQDGDNFAEGVSLEGTVHNVLIKDTTMENATDTTTGNYWNGDGFATEAGVSNVVFQNTVSRGNTDAGYDLKSTNTTLIDTVADDNSRNYRIWGQVEMINPVGLNPDKRGGSLNSQSQIWLAAGAKLTVTGGHFADAGSGTTVLNNEGGTATFNDTDITYASDAKLTVGTATSTTGVDVTTVASVGVNSEAGDVDFGAPPPPPATPPASAPPATPPATAPGSTDPGATGPTHTGIVTIISAAANEAFTATAAPEHFVYDQSGKTGADTIKGFGSTDLILTTQALADNNGDGIVTFGSNHILDLGANQGTVSLPGITSGLRVLGKVDGDYAYGDASVRPVKAIEGHLGVNDTLAGDKGDKAANTFFVDNALGQSMGDDKLTLFGAKDLLVTTAKLADVAIGATISATGSTFSVDLGDTHLGSLAITGVTGGAVQAIEYDGTATVSGHQYYVYSLVDSTAGLSTFAH
jgi:hypothetical protein